VPGTKIAHIAGAVLLTVSGTVACTYHIDAVTHAPGSGSAGYSVDYGDATPTPGTSLVQGEAVSFRVRVRYSLRSAKQGRLVLFFEDGSGDAILSPGTTEATGTAIDIQQTGGRKEATLSHEIAVPTNIVDLVAVVGVYPEGTTTTSGALLLKYRVVPSSDAE
jgi:hypothetical protein